MQEPRRPVKTAFLRLCEQRLAAPRCFRPGLRQFENERHLAAAVGDVKRNVIPPEPSRPRLHGGAKHGRLQVPIAEPTGDCTDQRSEENTSELQSQMRHSYAAFRLKKNKN